MKFVTPAQDPWHTCAGEDGPQPHPAAADHKLLTLEQWHAVRDTWPQGLATGVLLSNEADVAELAADLPRLSLVVLQFPKWVDGRAYSQAHMLRARYKFPGEIRAIGEVLVDMLPLLKRCGVDAVQLRGDQRQDAAERALGFFPGHYQADVNEPRPLFARTGA
ncbi:DUF934 domain-containing protein [Roseateles amylovorans]|uniref:DUF934 domain-containing protein n=1 Tax=Roseateles amylovorans TaxID=2978473 RepID=A0ABY6B8C1_9BURK|nr:DUF934 domain-containing protein [Roseateles amylovorans]UXH79462.1 DUF934 domain-containing protein [Roseateles amylovorans]